MITTLSAELTTPVPAPLARQLNLRPGTQLDWAADAEGMVIHVKVSQTPLSMGERMEMLRRLREIGTQNKREGEDAVADLIREREIDDELRRRVLE